MTDLVFLLLIFFIIMSTMTNQGLPVDLPEGDGTTNEKSVVDIGVNESNEYFLDKDGAVTYNFVEVKPILVAKMAESGEENLKIHGDKGADYEFVFAGSPYLYINRRSLNNREEEV